MKNDNVTDIAEDNSDSGKSKFMIYTALAVASVVGIMAFALAIRNNGETETVDFTNENK